MSFMEIMSLIMGLWYGFFALLKISDLKGFQAIFIAYDPFAKHSHMYAYVYPWFELTLAVGWFSVLYFPAFMWPLMVIWVVFGVLTLIGIAAGIRNKCTLCACMGSRVKLRLGFISVLEQAVMLVMIAFMAVDMLTMDHASMMMDNGTMKMMDMSEMDHGSM